MEALPQICPGRWSGDAGALLAHLGNHLDGQHADGERHEREEDRANDGRHVRDGGRRGGHIGIIGGVRDGGERQTEDGEQNEFLVGIHGSIYPGPLYGCFREVDKKNTDKIMVAIPKERSATPVRE